MNATTGSTRAATSSTYYLTAKEATDALGVTRATLYAYASRGAIHSEAVPGRPRERQYLRQDIERLRQRKAARRDPSRAAAGGLHWGDPVLESSITLIHDGRFFYRGRDAVAVASSATVEEAAALLWDVGPRDAPRLFDRRPILPARVLRAIDTCTSDRLARMQMALAAAGALDPAAHDLRAAAVRQTAARIVRLMGEMILQRHGDMPLHEMLQLAWAPRRRMVADAIRTALILCADHELNVSAFTARAVASAGASPYDVVVAALSALRGYKHGGAAARVSELLQRAGSAKDARAAIAAALRSGAGVPGFGHLLYPGGDPRARVLLRLAAASGNVAAWTRVRRVVKAGGELLQDHPTLDLGLAALTLAYELPEDAALLIFAVGRTVGWLAHALEEYASGQIMRPRARYVGPPPH